jgi:hypothetical protein
MGWDYIQVRSALFFRSLVNLKATAAATENGPMCVRAARRHFKVPAHVQTDMDTAQAVRHHCVAVIRKAAVDQGRTHRKTGPAGNALPVVSTEQCRPAPSCVDLQVSNVDGLAWEEHPHHQIHEVRADIGQTLALDAISKNDAGRRSGLPATLFLR